MEEQKTQLTEYDRQLIRAGKTIWLAIALACVAAAAGFMAWRRRMPVLSGSVSAGSAIAGLAVANDAAKQTDMANAMDNQSSEYSVNEAEPKVDRKWSRCVQRYQDSANQMSGHAKCRS